jgi:hypothetical protein
VRRDEDRIRASSKARRYRGNPSDGTQVTRYVHNILASCLVRYLQHGEINDFVVVLPYNGVKCPYNECQFVVEDTKSEMWRSVFKAHFARVHGSCGLKLAPLTARREELLCSFPELVDYLPQRLVENWIKFVAGTRKSLASCVYRWAESPDRSTMWHWLLKIWHDIKKQRVFQKDDDYVRLIKLRVELLRYCVPWFIGMRLPSSLEDGQGCLDSELQADFKRSP